MGRRAFRFNHKLFADIAPCPRDPAKKQALAGRATGTAPVTFGAAVSKTGKCSAEGMHTKNGYDVADIGDGLVSGEFARAGRGRDLPDNQDVGQLFPGG